MEKTELQKRIDIGNKRMAIITCINAAIFSIPMFFLINQPKYIQMLYFCFWMVMICIGALLSPKIIYKIWKE
jgi:putative Mn2+ efflux pump MntP